MNYIIHTVVTRLNKVFTVVGCCSFRWTVLGLPQLEIYKTIKVSLEYKFQRHSTHGALSLSISMFPSLSNSLHAYHFPFTMITSFHLDALHKWKHRWTSFFSLFSNHLSLKRNFAIITLTIAATSSSPPSLPSLTTITTTTTIHTIYLMRAVTGIGTQHHTNWTWLLFFFFSFSFINFRTRKSYHSYLKSKIQMKLTFLLL